MQDELMAEQIEPTPGKLGNVFRLHCKKSQKNLSVIPEKAGIHSFQIVNKGMGPLLQGDDNFLQ